MSAAESHPPSQIDSSEPSAVIAELAWRAATEGNLEEAIELLEERRQLQVSAESYLEAAETCDYLGRLHLTAKQWTEAADVFDRGMAYLEHVTTPGPWMHHRVHPDAMDYRHHRWWHLRHLRSDARNKLPYTLTDSRFESPDSGAD